MEEPEPMLLTADLVSLNLRTPASLLTLPRAQKQVMCTIPEVGSLLSLPTSALHPSPVRSPSGGGVQQRQLLKLHR